MPRCEQQSRRRTANRVGQSFSAKCAGGAVTAQRGLGRSARTVHSLPHVMAASLARRPMNRTSFTRTIRSADSFVEAVDEILEFQVSSAHCSVAARRDECEAIGNSGLGTATSTSSVRATAVSAGKHSHCDGHEAQCARGHGHDAGPNVHICAPFARRLLRGHRLFAFAECGVSKRSPRPLKARREVRKCR